MRYHELALQKWLNRIIITRYGVSCPVVFCAPMDAFSLFNRLWAEANNPFQYLLDAKDERGTPVYQPYPAPVRYPVISVHRKGWKYRQYQNYSIHQFRHINWPTVSDAGPVITGKNQQGTGLTRCNLGEVTTSRMPMAFDYRFQIDHFCNRPDTQAFFLSQLFREFWRTGGTQLQTWIKVTYPGLGDKLVRLYIEGDVDNQTPEEPADGKNVEYRTSLSIVLEGYDIDVNYKIHPALWTLLIREGTAPPESVNAAFDFTGTVDLRENPENGALNYRATIGVVPPAGTCAVDLRNTRMEAAQTDEIQFQSLIVTYPGPTAFPGFPPASGVEVFGGGTLSQVYVVPFTGTETAAASVGFISGKYT